MKRNLNTVQQELERIEDNAVTDNELLHDLLANLIEIVRTLRNENDHPLYKGIQFDFIQVQGWLTENTYFGNYLYQKVHNLLWDIVRIIKEVETMQK